MKCRGCGYVTCVCNVQIAHRPGCRYRRAALLTVELACEHGYQACPTCDPCTCGASKEATKGIR